MATRAAKSLDFPELLAALAGIATPTDERTMANTYAGTSGKDLITALNIKAGTTNKDLPEVFVTLASSTKGTDVHLSIKKITG